VAPRPWWGDLFCGACPGLCKKRREGALGDISDLECLELLIMIVMAMGGILLGLLLMGWVIEEGNERKILWKGGGEGAVEIYKQRLERVEGEGG
jgi:hypothetical protein